MPVAEGGVSKWRYGMIHSLSLCHRSYTMILLLVMQEKKLAQLCAPNWLTEYTTATKMKDKDWIIDKSRVRNGREIRMTCLICKLLCCWMKEGDDLSLISLSPASTKNNLNIKWKCSKSYFTSLHLTHWWFLTNNKQFNITQSSQSSRQMEQTLHLKELSDILNRHTEPNPSAESLTSFCWYRR